MDFYLVCSINDELQGIKTTYNVPDTVNDVVKQIIKLPLLTFIMLYFQTIQKSDVRLLNFTNKLNLTLH